jgi:hypothetical protein
MTVNERLCRLGAIVDWDDAVRRRDRDAMIRLLEQVEVPEPHVTADAVLSDPKTYRF